MSLREYKKKRDFKITAEPAGKAERSAQGQLFVVQKHDATRLHFDFRLEMGGVLKSWAVPKGFSPTRGERRLAVQVEDHPLSYAKFEGIIPKGQYGGGTVMVWDFGTYEVEGDPEEALASGKLRCTLRGQKLQGEWTLVHHKHSGEERTWFLIKTGEDVRPVSKKAEEHSVITGRTLRQIAQLADEVWHSDQPDGQPAPETKSASVVLAKVGRKRTSPSRSKAPAAWVEPMKATLLKEPPVGPDWLYELKWDGYRALALRDGASVELISRNQKPLTADFPELAEALAQLPVKSAVLDGEICALDSEGRPRFQLLQSREMGQARPPLFFYIFDLLQLDGRNLMAQPLAERKKALQQLLFGAPEVLRYSGPIAGDVHDLLVAVRDRGMEGLIGKQAASPYTPGVRSCAWIKLKVSMEQEFVIGGYSPPKGTRQHFGALLVGYYAGETFHFAGKVGTGFDQAWLKRLHQQFQKLRVETVPFADLQKKSRAGRWGQGLTSAELRQCGWVRPELVCQVRFAEWTEQGLLRQPVFLGLREDQAPRDVKRETAR